MIFFLLYRDRENNLKNLICYEWILPVQFHLIFYMKAEMVAYLKDRAYRNVDSERRADQNN